MSAEADGSQETVFWVNRFSERSIRKVLESFRVLEPAKTRAYTVIPVSQIPELTDDVLRESLIRQSQDVKNGASMIELPVVHMPKRIFSHSYEITTLRPEE
jgi:hypothetical protein